MILDCDQWPVPLLADIYREAARDSTDLDETVQALIRESLTVRGRAHSRERAVEIEKMWKAHPRDVECICGGIGD